MARSIRIEFEGALYHIMARGNRREAIFLDNEDRCIFLSSLGEACGMWGIGPQRKFGRIGNKRRSV